MKLGDLFDKVKDITLKYFDEKVGDANKMFERIEKKIDDMSVKVEGFQDVCKKIDNVPDSLDEKFNGVHENINRTFTKADEIHRKIGEIPAALDEKFQNCDRKIESGFSEVDGKFDTVEKNISAISADVGKILKIYEDEVLSLKKSAEAVPGLRSQVENLNNTVKTQEEKISNLTADLNTAQNEKNSLANELGKKENELKTAQKNFQDVQEKFDTAKKSLQTWEESAEIYKPVRTALNNCETFQKFVEERGLNDNSDAGLFIFVQELGKTIDFVNDIYQVAVDAKKNQGNNAQPMTAEETAVYDALNKAYRKIWNIDVDIFTTPGSRKNISEPFEKTAFSNEAINLKDPRNKSLKYTTKIYVPMLLSREGRMYKQSYVEAGNL